jgi:hypothetical protein
MAGTQVNAAGQVIIYIKRSFRLKAALLALELCRREVHAKHANVARVSFQVMRGLLTDGLAVFGHSDLLAHIEHGAG